MQQRENTSEEMKCVSVHGGGTWLCPITAGLPGRGTKDQQNRVRSQPVFAEHLGESVPEQSSPNSQ